MRRREVIAGIGVVATTQPITLQAQPPPRRVGLMLIAARHLEVFRRSMAELGYREGQNVLFDVRSSAEPAKLAGYLSELIAGRAEVIVAAGTQSTMAARAATKTIPIVMAPASDPVSTGLVESLAHPGGNVTGVSIPSTQLSAKRLDLLREIVPGLTTAAALWASDDPPAALGLKETEEAARTLGIALRAMGIREARDIDHAFEALPEGSVQALIVLSSPVATANARRIAELAIQRRLPAVGVGRTMAERGLLSSYGTSLDDITRRAARYVDRILKGARPQELPVEQPNSIEFVVNLTTLRALGLTLSPALLARANEMIE